MRSERIVRSGGRTNCGMRCGAFSLIGRKATLLAFMVVLWPAACLAWLIPGYEKVWEEYEWTEPVTGMEFVKIPGGEFLMGSPDSEDGRYKDEGPQHRVRIDGFWMGKYEVTNAQYRMFAPDHDSKSYEGHSLNGPDQPVVYISWEDAVKFVQWLNGRPQNRGRFEFFLPSEAQWEYACRAGTQTARFWGEDPDGRSACAYANVRDSTMAGVFKWASSPHECNDHFVVTAPVDSEGFSPNPFGLYHMLGNVWEWCRDIYSSEAYSKRRKAAANPVVEAGGSGDRVFRGGSWHVEPAYVRCAYRHCGAPGGAGYYLGFRLGGKQLTF